jgi:hypothetical protein
VRHHPALGVPQAGVRDRHDDLLGLGLPDLLLTGDAIGGVARDRPGAASAGPLPRGARRQARVARRCAPNAMHLG